MTRRMPRAIRRRDLKPGDVILNEHGRPYFKVVRLDPGSRPHHFIVIGDQLCPGTQTAGPGDTLLPVLRKDPK
jgi:hypothetical protein